MSRLCGVLSTFIQLILPPSSNPLASIRLPLYKYLVAIQSMTSIFSGVFFSSASGVEPLLSSSTSSPLPLISTLSLSLIVDRSEVKDRSVVSGGDFSPDPNPDYPSSSRRITLTTYDLPDSKRLLVCFKRGFSTSFDSFVENHTVKP